MILQKPVKMDFYERAKGDSQTYNPIALGFWWLLNV